MKGRKSTVGYTHEKGTFEAFLQEVNCFTKEAFGGGSAELGLTFLWNMGEHPDDPDKDLIFFDSFVTLYQDDDGYPVVGGKGGKVFKRLYGLYGKDFEPTDEDIDFDVDFPKQFDDVETLMDMPDWKSYEKDDVRLKLRSLKLYGKELIGLSAMIELGHAMNPTTKKPSEKISVIDCKPMPKTTKRRPQPVEPVEEETEDAELPV